MLTDIEQITVQVAMYFHLVICVFKLAVQVEMH